MTVFQAITLELGAVGAARFRLGTTVGRPMLLLEAPTVRFRQVLMTSLTFEQNEQIAIEGGLPAELFAQLPPLPWGPALVTLPPLRAGDEAVASFANPCGPSVAFCVWFGELDELRKLQRPDRCKQSARGAHVWQRENAEISRARRCVLCRCLWVPEL